MPHSPSISLILLMYNEAANIRAAVEEALAFCKRAIVDWEIIVVDDGSTDNSAEVIHPLVEQEPNLILLRHDANRGMGAAIKTGIAQASKSHFIFNATDGQIAMTEIGKMIPFLERAPIVLSTYANRRETWVREWMSRAFRIYLRALLGIRFKLQGLYLFPTSEGQQIAPHIPADTFYFNFEIIRRGLLSGLSTATTEIECRPRTTGRSHVVNPRRILQVSKDALKCRLAP